MNSALRGLLPGLQPAAQKLLSLPQARGCKITSVRRTRALQTKLYRDYLAGRSKYPAAPPGTSMHEFGRAFDITGTPAQLKVLGQIWEAWGGKWGGHYGDPIHFEA